MKKCVIIGSGLGGLSTGVILAKNGYEVTILEQSHQIGGCLQCFERNGVKFETGMHFIGSMEEGQSLSNYFKYLEIRDKISLSRLDDDAYDVVALHGERFSFPFGREAFIERFSERFPSQRKNLENYYDLVERVAALSSYYRTDQNETSGGFVDEELLLRNINEVIDQTISDPLLRDVLVGNLPLYAAQKDKTSFATHAFIVNFYNKSAYRIVGGSDKIAEALLEVLTQYGGRVLTRHKVTKILMEGKYATGVMTDNGTVFAADVVISDVHPSQVIDLVDEHAFTAAYKARVKSIPNTVSIFSLYLRFKEGAMPYMNYNFYSYGNHSPWDIDGHIDAEWPKGYLYMHHCYEKDASFAKGGVVMTYMSGKELCQWENTRIGRRGDDYEHLKHELAERVLDALEKDFPGIRETLADYYAATPLTYRDYTLTPEGSMYGLVKDTSLGAAGRVSFKTKVPNLLLVGQNINSHGMLGVLVGSLTACSHLIGEAEVKRQIAEANRKTVLIMGGGLGGLLTGALLAKENYKVTVLEKNAIIGGGLQSFEREDIKFPTGMHIFGGFQEGGTLRKIFSYLGVMDSLNIRPMDGNANDVVKFDCDHSEYRFPKGRKNFVEYLSSLFPEESEHIKAYVDKLYELAEEESLFFLHEGTFGDFNHSETFLIPFDHLTDSYISNPKLKSLLHYLVPLFSGVCGETPACIQALTLVSHLEGSFQFVGGSQQMADQLAEIIKQNGGRVLAKEEVVAIKVSERQVKEVVTKNGNSYRADAYISDLPTDRLLNIIDEGAFTKAFVNRLRQVKETKSCFKVYVIFKENAFPYLDHETFFVRDYDDFLHPDGVAPEEWPNGVFFLTPPVEGQGPYAHTMVINCIMDYDWVKPWEDTKVGRRGMEYEKWKTAQIEKVIAVMEKLYPHFRDCIQSVFASSPLTIRDYYGNKQGAMYGFHRDCNNMLLSQLSVFTKVRNLYLTGQNINFHGLYGVSMTAIETAEALVGHNEIVRKINEKYDYKK